MLTYSTSEEDHIKAIYHLQGEERMVSTSELSGELRTRPASVTDMLKKLKAKKLLNYEKYQGFRLSPEGKRVALGIIRRHRLWEYFLSEKLKFTWDEVHEVAEELEHVTSKKLIDKLDEYLGYPRFDPHGDPIPDPQGRISRDERMPITGVPLNQTVEVCHVSDQSAGMLDILRHNRIGMGTRVEVRKRFSYDNSLEVRIGRNQPLILSEAVARQIWVRKITAS